MEGVIVKIEVDDALSDAEVLSGVLDHRLEEVSLEVQDMAIVLEPLGSDSGDSVVLLSGSARDSSEGLGSTLTHGLKNRGVSRLSQRRGLLSDGAVLDTEQLSFVVACDCGVRVDISGQHWEAGG